VRAVGETLEPHRLCAYLYDLAGAFSSFFTNCPVLQAPDAALRTSRLRLCGLTGRVLEEGLGLLGIEALERM
jgi:arginyl-tRNA synthetase